MYLQVEMIPSENYMALPQISVRVSLTQKQSIWRQDPEGEKEEGLGGEQWWDEARRRCLTGWDPIPIRVRKSSTGPAWSSVTGVDDGFERLFQNLKKGDQEV